MGGGEGRAMVAGYCVFRNRGTLIDEYYVAAGFANLVDWDQGKE